MLQISVRAATESERLNIDEEAELPKGVVVYDSCDWESHFLCGLVAGDWVVDISGGEGILNWQNGGHFIVKANDDSSGYFRKD